MYLDDDLDQRLADAATPTTLLTSEVRGELDALVLATMPSRRRRGRTRSAVLAAGAVAGTIAVATAASAAGLLPGWVAWTTESGQTCEVRIVADPRTDDGAGPDRRFSADERAETLAAARAFLASFDYGEIDRDDAIERWQREEDAVIASQPDPAERQPRLTGDDLEVSAISREVTRLLTDDLDDRGLDVRAVEISWLANGCDL